LHAQPWLAALQTQLTFKPSLVSKVSKVSKFRREESQASTASIERLIYIYIIWQVSLGLMPKEIADVLQPSFSGSRHDLHDAHTLVERLLTSVL